MDETVRKIILASASPRRKELLTQIGLTFEIQKSQGEEIITKTEPSQVVIELSEAKATEIWEQLSEEQKTQSVVIGADTIVFGHGQIMGKPLDEQDAHRMITMLQDNTHQVYTGVTFLFEKDVAKVIHSFFECTKVTLYSMSKEEIDAYIATKDPFDKAGAYGIQGCFTSYVKGIEGDYNNVVGLPAGRVYQELKKEGLL